MLADDLARVEGLAAASWCEPEVYDLLGKVSGSLLIVYVLAKIARHAGLDQPHRLRQLGVHPARFYAFAPFGTWVLFAEIVVLGLVPALLLVLPRTRRDAAARSFPRPSSPAPASSSNRFVMTVQTLALPTLAFDPFLSYTPSWQEVASFLAVVAYGVILYSLSFRYLNLFPHERELAPRRRPAHVPLVARVHLGRLPHRLLRRALLRASRRWRGTLGRRRLARPARRPRTAERPRSRGTPTSRSCRPRPAPAATSSPARPRAGPATNGFDCRHCDAHTASRGAPAAGPAGADRGRGRPLRLRLAARSPLPPRAHLGAAGDGRHPHGRPRRPRPPPRSGRRRRWSCPRAGSRLEVNGPAGAGHHPGQARCGCSRRSTAPSSRSAARAPTATLRVDPGGTPDLRHLLSGAEARAWALRELERLQRAVGLESARRGPRRRRRARGGRRGRPPPRPLRRPARRDAARAVGVLTRTRRAVSPLPEACASAAALTLPCRRPRVAAR